LTKNRGGFVDLNAVLDWEELVGKKAYCSSNERSIIAMGSIEVSTVKDTDRVVLLGW
jgi:hypothetical protein